MLDAARGVPVDGDIRWVRRENIHLTLKFLGDVAPEGLEVITEALDQVAGRHRSFRVQPAGFGAFPSEKRARVLWSGVEEGSSALSKLAADVEQVLEPLGFGREKRTYKPHMTLGRAHGRPTRLPEGVGVRAPAFTARRLDLVESLPGAAGVTYEKLESYPLPEKF